ncbi:MAG: iron-containing alcohol dehydrogenase [Christensenellales bacterium]|jgi:alcohol dehydrogenase
MNIFYMPTKIVFGPGCLKRLAKEALPGKKALIVMTAGGSLVRNGTLTRVQSLLSDRSIQSVVFNKILPNPIKAHVMEGAKVAKEEGCDFIIGLGGGSAIDSAKSIALMATNPGDYWDYVFGGSGKGQKVNHHALPIVAITTTAGTGTEADPWTVITKDDEPEKIGFGNDMTFPALSFVDPELMRTVPPHLTAYQGFDALFHSIEGYIANIATPLSDGIALQSINQVAKNLAAAVEDGNNIQARTGVALGNTLAGIVETYSSCTSEHSFEHALSAFYPELPHGAGLIMLSLSYHTFFSKIVPDRYIDMARMMGASESDIAEKGAQAFVDALAALQKACGVDNLKMSDYGIKRDDIPALVRCARDTMGGLFGMDRYQLTDVDAKAILTDAYR